MSVEIVQFVWRAGDEMDDAWYDICIELLPADKADALRTIIALYARFGTRTKTHVRCWTDAYTKKKNMTTAELELLRTFEPHAFAEGAPPQGAVVVITDRFIVHGPEKMQEMRMP
jgi:hypothetical protein